MARLKTSGFELNSLTASVEWTTLGTGQTIGTTHARSGTYAGRISGMTSGVPCGFAYRFASAQANGPFWARAYLNIVTLPSGTNAIMAFDNSGTIGATKRGYIALHSDGTLTLHNSAGTQIGSATTALSTGVDYMLELKHDASPASGSRVTEARLNGAVFATSSSQTDSGVQYFEVGGNLDSEAQTQGEWWWDDVAINDSTGTAQTAYPGSGKVIHLHPSGAGDSTQWTLGAGSSNWSALSDVTPDSSTSFVSATVANKSDLYAMTDSGMGVNDQVNLVELSAFFRDGVADATAAIKFQIEKTASGTKSQSAAIVPNSNTFSTNTFAVPRLPPLTLYLDPDGSAWTQATVDSMQAGQVLSTAGTQAIQVSALWVAVEYNPAPVGTDTGTGADSSSLVTALSGGDTVTGADATSGSSYPAAAIPGAEVGAGVETSALTATSSAAETGHGTDTSALTAAVAGADTATGTETTARSATLSGADAGTGTETVSLAAALSGADVGSGADSSVLTAVHVSGDVGAWLDTESVAAHVSASDLLTLDDAFAAIVAQLFADHDFGVFTDRGRPKFTHPTPGTTTPASSGLTVPTNAGETTPQ